MVPNMNGMTEQQMMRVQQQMFGLGMNGDLRKNAMNNRNQFQPYVTSCWFFIALWRQLLILDDEEHRRRWHK